MARLQGKHLLPSLLRQSCWGDSFAPLLERQIMKKKFIFLGFLVASLSTKVLSAETFIFIDGHNEKQRAWVEKLNTIYLKEDLASEEIVVVDIADTHKEFTGEFEYVHDQNGVYMATYLPRRIPEVIETSKQFNSHSKLEDFAAKLFLKIAGNKEKK
ncbi:hypothetical protein [Vibrio nigripulchritudo]|uniref:hypothetical protein n=2 Tax=Vibrio nigripulchritudo TaxID=28173 RepID=UPI0012D2CF0D|nr:hypothetical protein [Vibrio nigripulchritudo]